jgi:hypothetical protein
MLSSPFIYVEPFNAGKEKMWPTWICKVEILNRILKNLAIFYMGMKMSQYMSTKYFMGKT